METLAVVVFIIKISDILQVDLRARGDESIDTKISLLLNLLSFRAL